MYQDIAITRPIIVPIIEAPLDKPKTGSLYSFLKKLLGSGYMPCNIKSSIMIAAQPTQDSKISIEKTSFK